MAMHQKTLHYWASTAKSVYLISIHPMIDEDEACMYMICHKAINVESSQQRMKITVENVSQKPVRTLQKKKNITGAYIIKSDTIESRMNDRKSNIIC